MRATLSAAGVGHALVVVGVVGDVAAVEVLLDAADAVLRPGVPGMAQARTSVSSRRNGWNPSGSVRNRAGKAGIASTSGTSQGSEALARKPSVSSMTGVMWCTAMRTASTRHGEAVGRRGGGEDRERRVAVAAVDGLEEVRLLGLGRQARWTARRAGC